MNRLDQIDYIDLYGQKAVLPKKQVRPIDQLTLEDILPHLLWQLYSLNPKYFYKCYQGGSVTRTEIIDGTITTTLNGQSKSMTVKAVLFNPNFTAADLLAFGVGTYDIQYKMENYYWYSNMSIFTKGHDYQYQLEAKDEIEANQAFSGTAVSSKGLYNISLSGSLDLTLKEGKNALTTDQIASLIIRGTAINIANPTETAVVNQTKIIGGNIWVSNGKIEKVELAGKIKTAMANADNFMVTMSAHSVSDRSYSLNGSSNSGQYQVAISGMMPDNLTEGRNSYSLYELVSYSQFGLFCSVTVLADALVNRR